MYSTRDLTLSIEYRIYQLMAQRGWVFSETAVAMTAITGDNIPANSYTAASIMQPWYFFDNSILNTSRSKVVIYRNGTVLNPTAYTVDFRHGRISFPAHASGTITADITHFAAEVREGYPQDEELSMATLPIAAFNIEGKQPKPFAVGSATDLNTYPLTIDLLCENDGQRKDLADDILDGIRAIPLLEMAGHSFLLPNNDINPDFNYTSQMLGFANVFGRNARTLEPRTGGLDKERFRSMLTASVKSIS